MKKSNAEYRQEARLNHLRGPSGRVVQGPGAIIVNKGPVLDLLAKGNKPKPQTTNSMKTGLAPAKSNNKPSVN